ncbi:MAG TPA: hypothetical protein VF762_15685, partial [Blastocatellia bacterium]
NAREERQRERAKKLSAAENERMARLYRQHVLKEEGVADTQIVQLKVGKVKGREHTSPAGFGD